MKAQTNSPILFGCFERQQSASFVAMRFVAFMIAMVIGFSLPAQQDNLSTIRQQMRSYYDQGNYRKAMSFGLSLVTEAGNHYGLQDPQVAESMESLGKLCLDMGEYASAAKWYRKAMGHRQQNIGMNCPEVGRCHSYLGEIYLETGEVDIAEQYLNESIERLTAAGSDYREWLAHPLELMAALRYMQAQYSPAETLYQEVMKIQEATQGFQSAALARSLNNIGGVYQAQGQYHKARAVYAHALNMQRSILGPDNLDMATTLVNQAVLEDQLGEFDKAEASLKKALAVREKQLPLTHPLIGSTIDNLISMYISIGSYDKAEACLAEIRNSREKEFGPDALALAPVYEKYASYHLARGDVPGAITWLEKATSTRETHLGPRDEAVAATLYNVGKLSNVIGRHDQARIALNRAMDIYDMDQIGDQGVLTALLAELMLTDYSQGRMEMAEERLLLMLTIKERVFGEFHPETASVLDEMGVFYQKTEQADKQMAIEQRLQKIYEHHDR